MKRIFLILLFCGLVLGVSLHTLANHHDTEKAKKAIETTIKDAYVDGAHNNGDGAAMRNGFHSDFVMFYLNNEGQLGKVTLEQWIERIEQGKAKNPDAPRPETTYKIRHIEVAGHSAVASLDVFKDGKHVFTDHMSLYHFEDGWKIVGKIFYSHKD